MTYKLYNKLILNRARGSQRLRKIYREYTGAILKNVRNALKCR